MIDFLRGTLAFADTDFVVLDVQGVGYRVFCANPYAVSAQENQTVMMYIHYHVREDAVQLYGFTSREEQSLFRRLLEVSGIGPRVALGILSAGRPDEVVGAIYQENLSFLMKLPGIGKKTAQRIILDLKDKLADLPMAVSAAALAGGALSAKPGKPAGAGHGSREWLEAKEALLSLGYTEPEADRVWPQVLEKAGEAASAETMVKLALQALFRG
ncbi:Holliday junction branch migration protein RuvA [Paenibacillus mesotrionivorans]|uniref:Holliday junction branch migration protein RuvA n=1 Tax=Paenibacillus mesotrionivorans TaxID=3160968 RepID=A0ACC7NTD1_9BACL